MSTSTDATTVVEDADGRDDMGSEMTSGEDGRKDLEYRMSDEAYSVMVMHAAKYVTAVIGILIGRVDPSYEVEAGNRIEIAEVLPLAHSDTAQFTTALSEMALMLGEQRAKLLGAELVGIYFANENPLDHGIPAPPTRIADRIREHFPSAVVLHLDADRMRPSVRRASHCARVRSKQALPASSWGRAVLNDQALSVSPRALNITDQILTTPPNPDLAVSPYDVTDFEDHCLDPRHDWLNEKTVSKLREMPIATNIPPT